LLYAAIFAAGTLRALENRPQMEGDNRNGNYSGINGEMGVAYILCTEVGGCITSCPVRSLISSEAA